MIIALFITAIFQFCMSKTSGNSITNNLCSQNANYHAARMETFNVQYVTTLHDRAAKHASRIPLRYFRTFTLRCIRHRIQRCVWISEPCTLLGTWFDINVTFQTYSGQINILHTRYLNIGILNL